jgi:hypothetical protein
LRALTSDIRFVSFSVERGYGKNFVFAAHDLDRLLAAQII